MDIDSLSCDDDDDFANKTNRMNSKFQNFDDDFLERSQSIYTSRFMRMPDTILTHIYDPYIISPMINIMVSLY